MEQTLIFRGGCDLTTQTPTILTLSDCIPCRYDAGICRHQREHTGVIEIMRVEQLGNVTERDRKNPSQGRVYNDNALAPTINTCGGGGLQPMIIVKEATKDGFTLCELGGVANLDFMESKTRRGRVIDNGKISPTILAESTPSVIEKFTWEIDGETYLVRIRKLTPRECWRLMDFSDSDFEKAQAVNSNTQLYKQAGNSIVRNVLVAILGQLIEGKEDVYKKGAT